MNLGNVRTGANAIVKAEPESQLLELDGAARKIFAVGIYWGVIIEVYTVLSKNIIFSQL